MGIIYNKSRSESFRPYFSQTEEFERQFSQYDFEQCRIIKERGKNLFKNKKGGGVPLSWNEGNHTVSVDQADSHTLIVGPTGSKKTRLIAMPTVRILGDCGESVIISDPKAEIYSRTSGYLKNLGYDIKVINLRKPDYSNRWNPLRIPYRFYCQGDKDKAYEFANDIAQNMLSDSYSKDPFWENSAASLLFGLIMLLFMYCRDYHMPEECVNFNNIFELRNILFSGTEFKIKSSFLWRFAQKDPIIKNSLIGTVETAKDTRGGILSTFDQGMRNICIQPNLLEMLSGNDIDLDIFLNQKQALYVITPDEKTSYHKLVSLFIKQSYEYFIYLAQQELYSDNINTGFLNIRVNYILDEFSSLPTIMDFPAMVTASRSRNIRFMLFIQSKHQLMQRYKEETETILVNCTNWIFLTTRELALLEDISKLCGTKEQKPILAVAQLQRLNKDEGETLVLCGRNKPYISKLPDIELYDKGNFEIVHLVKNVSLEVPPLDLSLLENETEEKAEEKVFPDFMMPTIDKSRQYAFPPSSLTNEQIDRMIAEIDLKLKQLDEEEKRSKEENKDDI